MQGSFDRFSERARRVLTLAQEEAQRFNHNYIGTEHLLLGLMREGEGVAARVLSNLGVELTNVRSAVEFIIGRGERQVMGDIGLTPRAKKVIDLAVDEARRLGHHYIGTEHLLLGLLREKGGVAAGVLEKLGLNVEMARSEVVKVLTSTRNTESSKQSDPQRTWTAANEDGTEETLSPQWRFLVVSAVVHDGITLAEPFFAPAASPIAFAQVRIHHALELLGQEGWELVGVLPLESEEPRALYVFRRPA
jgi:ATP-dependent Clp protease ATP-binding subunit ClpA